MKYLICTLLYSLKRILTNAIQLQKIVIDIQCKQMFGKM